MQNFLFFGDVDNLNVTGRGLSPIRPHTPSSPEDANMLTVANSSRTTTNMSEEEDDASSEEFTVLDGVSPEDANMLTVANSSRTATDMSEEEDDASSEEFTVLDGVRQMNQMLVRQIETLRLKIKVDEKNYDQDKARLIQAKESELQSKEVQIEELRESVTAKDEAINRLTRAGEEKDRTIQSKCAEIEELKGMVKQTKEYAQKMHKQVSLAKQRREKLESDPLYQQQNEEISKLTKEVENLRESLATMESELRRALTVIDQQNDKLRTMDEERAALHAKFREDLGRASKAMRQEVERMREVMRQNYDEIRNLREQNQEMHGDVRAIMEVLRASKNDQRFQLEHLEDLNAHRRPITAQPHASPSYARQTHGQVTAVPPKGPGKMVGAAMSRNSVSENKRVYGGAALIPTLRESSQFGGRILPGRARGTGAASRGSQQQVDSSGYYSGSSTARISADVARSRAATAKSTPTHSAKDLSENNSRNNINVNDGKTLPAICSFKEGVIPSGRQQSGRGRQTVRKGSAVAKK
ncbi:hypothetical protein PoB_004611500 [Plakobranchus ocellatus]|uniref:Uncharacterized protein n=1 Tax=Plakobranchus ocellatus TaxID=259542 RepID=A0AAV4BJD0_9GAST|nr:hypothetical protein PoB_004611500 [Plakobranchus ocellatus]